MTIDLPSPEEIDAAILPLNPKEDSELAKAFRAFRDGPHGTGWDLLSQIFDIHFEPHKSPDPYSPMIQWNGKRSMIPDDLTEEQLNALRPTLEAVSDPEYRSRIGDIFWLRRRDAATARIAIEAYLESGKRLEDPIHWVACMERYERALRLASSLGKSEPRRLTIVEHLLNRVRYYNGEDPMWLSHRALALLHEFRGGDPAELAAIAAKAAAQAHANTDYRKAWEFHELEASFYRRAGDSAKMTEALRARAERMVEQAEAAEVKNSFLVAHSFWHDAIQAYRQVPNSGDRIRELHRRLNIAGGRMRDEMTPITSEVDLSDVVKRAKELLGGETFNDALCLFVAFEEPLDPIELRAAAEQGVKDHPVQAALEASIFDAAGRKVDVRPSALTDDPDQYERAIQGFMTWHADLSRHVRAAGSLVPGIQQILADHVVSEEAISRLISDSAFIPDGRHSMFARGIRLGFERDISTALHLLIPQLENALRMILAQQGVITTSLYAVGIEDTWQLGRILGEAKLKNVLGDSLVYELRSLLLRQPGANIRNLLAHGLLGDNALNSYNALYLWWIILRLVIWPTSTFRTFANSYKPST